MALERSGLPGATRETFAISTVSPANEGEYSVVVGNPVDSVVSWTAQLRVKIPLTLVEQPQSLTVNAGSTAIFSVRAAGSGPFNYQWRKGTTDLANATGPSLVLSNVQPIDAGDYSIIVSTGAENVASTGATLTVHTAPVITEHPKSRVGFVGGTATFSVASTGSAPLSFQWLHNSEPISGASNSTLTLPDVRLNLAGSYAVLVSNGAGSAVSEVALLTIRQVISEPRKGINGCQFQVNVPDGLRARLQVSSDLATWTDFGTAC